MEKVKLTNSIAKTYDGPPGRLWDSEITGFHLRIYPSGKKSWAFLQNPYGSMVFGTILELGAEKARSLAAGAKLKIKAKENPIAERRQRAEQVRAEREVTEKLTLQEAWSDYVVKYLQPKSGTHFKGNRHYLESVRIMEKHFVPLFGLMHPVEVSKREWLAFIENQQAQRRSTARKLQSLITNLYKWMDKQSKYTDEVNGLPPISGLVAPPKSKIRRLETLEQVRSYWSATDHLGAQSIRDAVRFILLSNKRTIDVLRMKVQHIDFEEKIWTISAEEYKNSRKQVVGLTDTLIKLIMSSVDGRSAGYVFSRNGGSSPVTLTDAINKKLVERAGVPYISIGDLRRTMSSHLADLGIPAEVRSKLRGHARGDIADVYEVNHMVPQQREAYALYAGKILDERGEF